MSNFRDFLVAPPAFCIQRGKNGGKEKVYQTSLLPNYYKPNFFRPTKENQKAVTTVIGVSANITNT